jgi:hypothetical protein
MLLKTLILGAVLLSVSCATKTTPLKETSIAKEPELISIEEWEPYFPKNEEADIKYKPLVLDHNQVLEREIRGIRIPNYRVSGTLIDAIGRLNTIIKRQKYTKEIPLSIHSSANEVGLIRTIDLENTPLDQILNIICQEYKVQKVIREGRVIVGFLKLADIKEKRIQQLSNDFALSLKGKDLKSFFHSAGVPFPEGTSIELIQGNYLLVDNLQENHRELEKVIVEYSYDISQVLLIAQIFEVTKPQYLRNVALPKASTIMAIPKEHRKVISRIATIGSSNSFVTDQKAQPCLVYGDAQKIKSSFIGTSLESTSLIDPDGITISINFKWRYNLEKSRRSVKENGQEHLLSGLQENVVKQAIKLWDGESVVVPLSQDSHSRRFLIISARILNSKFEFIRETGGHDDSLAPDGEIELFRNKKSGKLRIFTPAAQDDYIKRLIKQRQKRSVGRNQ